MVLHNKLIDIIAILRRLAYYIQINLAHAIASLIHTYTFKSQSGNIGFEIS